MTTYVKKAAFCPDSAILMGRFYPRNRCRQTDEPGVPADFTQWAGLFRISCCLVGKVAQVRGALRVRQVSRAFRNLLVIFLVR